MGGGGGGGLNKGKAAQQVAFDDMWHYTSQTEQMILDFNNTLETANISLSVKAFLKAWIKPLSQGTRAEKSLVAYLVYMTERLVLMKQVLKETGSIYYHCDPTASHYIKVIMDGIFGRKNFQNEIIWCYAGTGARKKWGRKHDVLLFYRMSNKCYFNPLYRGRKEKEKNFNKVDDKGRRYWEWTKGKPVYWDDYKGRTTHDWWIEIPSLGTRNQAKEYCGYPTQKPLQLLQRIIEASCPLEGTVLDPFCGCGTACVEASLLGRKWIGIDISTYAMNEVVVRLDEMSVKLGGDYELIRDYPPSWNEYSKLDPYKKQDVLIRKLEGRPNSRKSGDGGVDGELEIHLGEGNKKGEWGKVVFSVKTGKGGNPSDIRELKGLLREGYDMGCLIIEKDPTEGLERSALKAGQLKYSKSKDYPPDVYDKIQILTAQDIICGEHVFNHPPTMQDIMHYRNLQQKNLI